MSENGNPEFTEKITEKYSFEESEFSISETESLTPPPSQLETMGQFGRLFDKIHSKSICVCYKVKRCTRVANIVVSHFNSWETFLKRVEQHPGLALPVYARKIYYYINQSSRTYVTEVSALSPDRKYYVETDLNRPDSKGWSEEFIP